MRVSERIEYHAGSAGISLSIVLLLRCVIRPGRVICAARVSERIEYHAGGDRISLVILVRFRYAANSEVVFKADSILREKSKEFAKQIIILCRDVKSNRRESVLTNQLLRSGTSIGANIHEAQYAQGKKDFISKLEIAQKECYETEYWLELLHGTGYIPDERYKPLQNSCGSIRRILIASLNTAKGTGDFPKTAR